jgi:uncharacterized repeat protein (TIGR03803 family)
LHHYLRLEAAKGGSVKEFSLLKITCIILAFSIAAATASSAQTYRTLVQFDITNGELPNASVVQGADGNFYGTTFSGGAGSACFGAGCGTVFKITPAGKLTTLHSFNITDGAGPYTGVIRAADGNFYGTTQSGGANESGTVFKMTLSGKVIPLYNFCSTNSCADGIAPQTPVVQGSDGDFYGTTASGGGNKCNGATTNNCGTIFKMTSRGKLTTLASFDTNDGYYAVGGLVEGIDGNFYGIASEGGTGASCPSALACGTVFKITPKGTLTALYSFCSQPNCTDGFGANGLVLGADGNFYGTTSWGGANQCDASGRGCGTIFKITPAGMLTTVHSFDGWDGFHPSSVLVPGFGGSLYGTTAEGGTDYDPFACPASQVCGTGTVFGFTPGFELTSLYSFNPSSSPSSFDGLVIQGTNGTFFGTSYNTPEDGTVFSLSVPGQNPFVEPQPASGKVGSAVVILGNNLTGATEVSFNGTPATFTVFKAGTALKAVVPKGATTGTVTVTTAGSGTLTSNVVFRVRP